MSADHYAILGVAPTAQPAAIRAAYLALMREFHPDRNPGPAASERTQSIIAAYKVLGDFDSRQEYDWGRRRAREAAAAVAETPRRRLSAGLVTVGAIGLAAIGGMMLRPSETPAPPDRVPDVVAETAVTPVAKHRKVVTKREKVPAVVERSRAEPVLVAAAVIEKPLPTPMKAARAPVIKAVTFEPFRHKVMAAKGTPRRPATTSDLVPLEQFVMTFYRQSWKYGDARKRDALDMSRTLFEVRRAACAVDSCRRSEILRLQRDVSSIVESGAPAR